MKKLVFLFTCALFFLLISCDGPVSAVTPDETYSNPASFQIQNKCDQNIVIAIGTVPKTGDRNNPYNWEQSQRGTILGNRTINSNESLEVQLPAIKNNEAYFISCQLQNGSGNGWGVEKDSYLVIFTNSDENKKLRMNSFNGGKGKIEKSEDPDIYSLKITNNCTEALGVSLGSCHLKNGKTDWNSVEWDAFLNNTLLMPQESITIFAKYSKGIPVINAFSLNGKSTVGIAIPIGNNHVTIINTKDGLTIKSLYDPSIDIENTNDDLQPLESLSQTFDQTLERNRWITRGLAAKIIDDTSTIDNHGKIFKLGTYDEKVGYGNSTLILNKVYVEKEAALSFDYRCDLLEWQEYITYFKIYIDDFETPIFTAKGSSQSWQKTSIIIPKGLHSIVFVTDFCDNWGHNLTNAVYLDNISLLENNISSVGIYPKGLQETYVNGDTIQFTAKALRANGSVMTGKTVTWSATGGSIDNNGLFTPGDTQGTYTVTASIDGKTASNQTVKIHGENYLADPVTINGHTFTGEITEGTVAIANTKNIIWENPTPQFSTFTTDGFFVLKGHAENTDAVVFVTKMDDDDTTQLEYSDPDYKYSTCYLLPRGDFQERIWLRYGDGKYDIQIHEANIEHREDYDGYEGAISSWRSSGGSDTHEFLTVTNKTGLNYSPEDAAFLMPSFICQSDNFLISNGFNAVMAELLANASLYQKLKALYEWEICNLHYDYVSIEDDPEKGLGYKRKKQDAFHVVKYNMAVCEGYANLYTALARLLGVKAAYQNSQELQHGWAELFYEGQWKLVDATWDDPSDDPDSPLVNYNYLLIDVNGINNDHNKGDKKTVYSRNAGALPVSLNEPYLPDMRY